MSDEKWQSIATELREEVARLNAQLAQRDAEIAELKDANKNLRDAIFQVGDALSGSSLAQIRADNAALRERCKGLEEIVGEFPKTADGVTVNPFRNVPPVTLWFVGTKEIVSGTVVGWWCGAWESGDGFTLHIDGNDCQIECCECYSTREAAEREGKA